jgi:hypothetical protein
MLPSSYPIKLQLTYMKYKDRQYNGQRLKIPKELPEAVILSRTDNTMVKRLKIPKELPEAVIPRRTGQQKK